MYLIFNFFILKSYLFAIVTSLTIYWFLGYNSDQEEAIYETLGNNLVAVVYNNKFLKLKIVKFKIQFFFCKSIFIFIFLSKQIKLTKINKIQQHIKVNKSDFCMVLKQK